MTDNGPASAVKVPSSLTEISLKLAELARSQDMIFEQLGELSAREDLAAIEQKLNLILDALKIATNEAGSAHQERVDLVRRVATLEHKVALLEGTQA